MRFNKRMPPIKPLIEKEDPYFVRMREKRFKEWKEQLPDDWATVESFPEIGNVMNSPEIMGIIETAQSLGLNEIRVNKREPTGDPGMDRLVQRLEEEDILFRF